MQRQTRPRRNIVECPICDTSLYVSELSCPACQTRLKGQFPTPPLAQLSVTHQEFIQTFVECRGIIRDVEEVLGISYPTVRARLDAVIEALNALTTSSYATTSSMATTTTTFSSADGYNFSTRFSTDDEASSLGSDSDVGSEVLQRRKMDQNNTIPKPDTSPEELKEKIAEARQRELLRLVENGDLDPSLAAEALRNRNLL